MQASAYGTQRFRQQESVAQPQNHDRNPATSDKRIIGNPHERKDACLALQQRSTCCRSTGSLRPLASSEACGVPIFRTRHYDTYQERKRAVFRLSGYPVLPVGRRLGAAANAGMTPIDRRHGILGRCGSIRGESATYRVALGLARAVLGHAVYRSERQVGGHTVPGKPVA